MHGEAQVIGYVWGEDGLMANLIVSVTGDSIGKFLVSGFTDDEREMDWDFKYDAHDEFFTVKECGTLRAGEICDDRFENRKFPIGSIVTFEYQKLDDSGRPKRARYWRKHASN